MPGAEHKEEIKQPQRRDVHIRDYFVVISRHRWIILAAVIVTIASTILYLSRTESMYKTSVKLLIGQEKGDLSLFKNLGFLGQARQSEEMETYCELLRTYRIMREVVENTRLHKFLDKPDNSNLPPAKLSKTISPGNGNSQSEVSEEMRIRQATKMLQDMVLVQPVRDTRIIEITVSGADPDVATDVANEIARVFIKSNLQGMKGEAKVAYDFISEQLKQVQEKLHSAEEKLRRFKEAESVVELTEEARITLGKLSEIESGYNTTIAQRQEAQARLGATREELEKQAETVISSTTIGKNPIVQQLEGQLYGFEIELAGLLRIYPEDTPEVEQVKTKISQTKEKLNKEVERIITSEISSVNPVHQTLLTRIIQLESDAIAYGAMAQAQKTFVEQYRAELDKLPLKELQLARLTRDRVVSNQTYMMLIQHREEAQLAQAVQVGNISVADPAIRPLGPYSPNRKITLIMGGLLGLFLGVGFAFFLEYLDDTIRMPDDINDRLDAALLGVIPQFAKARGSKMPPIVLQDKSRSSPAEAYRSLRTNLLFSDMSNPPKTIVVTSAGPQEGKSLTIVNLSVAMAQAGQNVLLVDADLRRPMLHRVFNVERSKGLSTVLAGELTIDETVVKTDIPNLSVLTSGALPSNPSEILGSLQMKELISQTREQYDIVLFDSAPTLTMADTPVLCSEVDGVLLIINAGNTTRKALGMTIEQLELVEARILGVVLNNVDFRRDRYYYYYYYYYSPYEDKEEKKLEKRRKRYTKGSRHSKQRENKADTTRC